MTIPNDVVMKLAESISAIRSQIEDLESDEKQFYDSAKDQGIPPAELKKAIAVMRMDPEKKAKKLAQMDMFDSLLEAVGVRR